MSVRGLAISLALLMTVAPGCAGRKLGWFGKWGEEQPTTAAELVSPAVKPAANAVGSTQQQGTPSDHAVRATYQADASRSGAPANGDAAAWDALMAEVQKVGPLTEPERVRLIEDMRKSDPTLWPLIVEAFQTARAYREQRGVRGALPGAVVTPNMVAETESARRAQTPVHSSAESILTKQTPRNANQFPPGIPTSESTDAEPRPQETAAATNSASSVRIANLPETVETPNASAASITTTQKPDATAAAAANTTPSTNAASTATTTIFPAAATTTVPTVSTTDSTGAGAASATTADSLANAIREWEAKPPAPPGSAEALHQKQQLRLLYLLAGRRDDALRPIEGASAADQAFWSAQVYALASYFDTARNADVSRRAAESKLHLDEATAALSQSASLFVRNATFCTEVSSFGVFTRVEKNEFAPRQQALIYAEIENFKSEQTPKGFHTSLRSSYRIFDARGTQVDTHEFPLTEEYCQNRRKDFFIRYFLTIPERMYDGKYTLQLTIEDTIGAKIGQTSIDFFVKAGQPAT